MKSLSDVFQEIDTPRVAVVGDCMVDEYVWGKVERISPEGPFPVLRDERRETRLGGAGNVVANLAALGAQVLFYTAVGADAEGERAGVLLEQAGCRDGRVLHLDDRPTTLKRRHIGYVQHADRAMQQLLRVDREQTTEIPVKRLRPLLDALRDAIGDIGAVLVSDYNKGLLGEAFLRELLKTTGGRVPVLVDPARISSYQCYSGSMLMCPNRYETSLATGMPCEDVAQCGAAGQRLAADLGIEHVAVTMDRDGIVLCAASGEPRHFATKSRAVTDVTGAGDMVLAMLGFVIAGKADIADAVRLANIAAGIEVRRMGAVPVSRSELLTELLYRGHTGAVKIATAEELEGRVADLRASGKRVVFTNGCFDLLHFGHHILLNQARQFGDCLVVAVNSDRSIRRLKGPGRPLNTENERMLMLCSLESVDHVVLFDEDTPVPLLERLRPDVLVKGSEYRDGTVVGREVVEAHGGVVELVEQVPGISTSALLERFSK